ncbi:hypothetical protein L916_20126 [Phytophthora nicotianae]|uniref:Uncharacterized protein n=1 Tax=Phytophthora nicotianae TaxID=4792 RepID=W2HY50_PHYNI|nr:hypothetical protein L916_20126 [Phytophthora nicotianae]
MFKTQMIHSTGLCNAWLKAGLIDGPDPANTAWFSFEGTPLGQQIGFEEYLAAVLSEMEFIITGYIIQTEGYTVNYLDI